MITFFSQISIKYFLRNKAGKLVKSFRNFILWKKLRRIKQAPLKIINKNILIIKPDNIGDYVLFRDSIKIIKNSKKFKEYNFYLLGNKKWKELFNSLDSKYIKQAFFIDFGSLYKMSNSCISDLLKNLNSLGFEKIVYPVFSRDPAIDLLIGKINSLEKVSSRGDSVNDAPFFGLNSKVYTQLFDIKYDFEFENYRLFFEKIILKRINIKNPSIEIKRKKEKMVILNPGAASPIRMWHYKNFVKLTNFLSEQGFSICVLGSFNETPLAEKIKKESKYSDKVKIMTNLTLSESLNQIAKSSFVVSNETGTVHLAIALGKKVICISNGNHYNRFHPYPNYKKARYIYPPNFNPKKDLDNLGRSFLDINKIDFEEVLSVIKKNL